jgi:predicted nucleotidyltransferase component of viral defense system
MFHLSTIETTTYQTLQKLFSIQEIKENFALAGGTSLALQTGHRQSIDLDIFSPKEFSTEELQQLLSSEFKNDFILVNRSKRMLFSFIENVKTDFVYEPAALIQPFIEYEGVNYFHLFDIAAMKMHTICGRGKKKDFFDIYVLTELLGWKEMIRLFEQKYDSSQLYFLWRSIHYFQDAEEDADIAGLPPYQINWKQIKDYIKKNCI